MSELKPCPFCGCEYDKDEEDYYYSGEHEKWCPLGNQGNIYKSNFLVGHSESEMEAWNTRANECDRDELLKVADEIDRIADNASTDGIGIFLQVSTIRPASIKAVADRIRKALGV